ncbi:MAG: glycosyltransferase family 9 protein [Rhodobacterales bacterium]|nr:glycosyltransferase family 9 protein [Rhodobacterales bacterium]
MASTFLLRLTDRLDDRRRRARPRPGPARGLLLISAGGLGDTVLFSLVLDRFAALAEDGEPVTVLLRSDAAKMAFLFPDTVTVEAVDFAKLRHDRAYRRQVHDGLYDAHYRQVIATDYLRHPDLDESCVRAAAAPALAMAPRPWPKHDRALDRNRTLYTRLFDSGRARRDKVLRWAAFADWLTGTEAPAPVVRLPESRLPAPAQTERPTVLIQAFSAVGLKQVPPAFYGPLLDALPENTDVRLLGAPGDLDRFPEFRALLDRPGVTFDASRFAELVPLLRAADLVVSVDTALMHLAAAVGAPTLCLASAAYVGEIVPYDDAIMPPNLRVMYEPMPCEGCLGDCINLPRKGMYPCVWHLDPAAARDAALTMMGARP